MNHVVSIDRRKLKDSCYTRQLNASVDSRNRLALHDLDKGHILRLNQK